MATSREVSTSHQRVDGTGFFADEGLIPFQQIQQNGPSVGDGGCPVRSNAEALYSAGGTESDPPGAQDVWRTSWKHRPLHQSPTLSATSFKR